MAEPITNVLGIVSIKNRGEYNSETSYEKLNVVTYQGSSYCAKGPTQGNLPTNTNFWDLMAEKGDIGPAPVRGVDYWTPSDVESIESDLESNVTTEVTSQLGSLVSATPLGASSMSDMTDTTRIYVLATDGHWYWYDGANWQDGGLYQATGDSENYMYQTKLTNFGSYESNKYVDYTNGITYNYNNNYASDYIEVMKESKIIIENFTTINADKRGLAFYDENKTFISGVQYPSNSSGIEAITPQNAKYLRFTFYVTNETTIVKIIFKNEILISNLLNPSIKTSFDITNKIKKHEYNRK